MHSLSTLRWTWHTGDMCRAIEGISLRELSSFLVGHVARSPLLRSRNCGQVRILPSAAGSPSLRWR
jgi:hypothetical protein